MATQIDQKNHQFFSQFPTKSFKAGEIIIRPDIPINEIFYISSGSVRMYLISPDGEEVTLHIFTSLLTVSRLTPIQFARSSF